jgi:hypothetical protein
MVIDQAGRYVGVHAHPADAARLMRETGVGAVS